MTPGSFFLEIYGCQMNLADGELIAGVLRRAGWRESGQADEADLLVINTCAVRERAVERVVGHVRSLRPWKRARRGRRIALVGCLARYDGSALAAQLEEVDLFLGPDGYRHLPALLAEEPAARLAPRGSPGETYEGLTPARRPGVNAWISIMRGCDRMCAYCMVPFARGRERSLPAGAVLEEARQAVADGHPSLTLLGQTVTSYRDGETDFAALIGEIARSSGAARIRFLSPHPADFTDRLLDAIAQSPRIARHFHLPVQAGSNRVLAAMRRGYTREDYLALVERARERLSGLAVTTDLLTGFPGETEEDFAQTLDLMERVRFDSAFLFAYSERPRTYAARRLPDDVPSEVKQERLRRMIALQEKHGRVRYLERIGARVEVLVEGAARSPANHWYGRSDDFKDVIFSAGADPRVGEIVPVAVKAATSHTLFGERMAAAEGL
ncbi:MAG: tRNA (N6-isopentenyl adenosine(37)-C2)-methylthiotransferase MiaB [Candidatus Eisenbacteria bacterium]|nr:tRNA (N6-isopentenyl adenosine(37)-C2)-methylthiotransferase MiaB [Candidatus Eisenbacteria bacterium]